MNNREIKFRIWQFDRFIEDSEFNKFYIKTDGQVTCSIPDLHGGELMGELCDFIVQQFTGLLDKTGREIYEGDIVLIPENDPYSTSGNALLVAEFRYGCFGYTDILTKKFESLYSLIGESETDNCAEVIGNIFEDPELLK